MYSVGKLLIGCPLNHGSGLCILQLHVSHEFGKGIMPVWHGGQAAETQHALFQTGVQGTWRRTGKIGSRAGQDGLCFSREAEDFTGEFGPRGFAFACQMEGADQFGMFKEDGKMACNGQRGRGIAVLVVNDFEDRPRAVGKIEHGMDKAWAAWSVKP